MSEAWSRAELEAGAGELGLTAIQRQDVTMARDGDGPETRSLLAAIGRIGRKALQRKATPVVLGTSHAHGFTPARDPAGEVRYLPARPDAYSTVFPPPPPMSTDEVDELRSLIHPLKITCKHCGKWQEVRTSLDALRQHRLAYLDDLQERADVAWRANPAVRAAVDAEARWVAEARAEAAEAAEAARRRQLAADSMFRELVATWGLPIAEARAMVAARYGEDW